MQVVHTVTVRVRPYVGNYQFQCVDGVWSMMLGGVGYTIDTIDVGLLTEVYFANSPYELKCALEAYNIG